MSRRVPFGYPLSHNLSLATRLLSLVPILPVSSTPTGSGAARLIPCLPLPLLPPVSVAAILDVQVQAALLGKNVKAVVQLKDEGGRLVKVQVRVCWGKMALGYAQGGP